MRMRWKTWFSTSKGVSHFVACFVEALIHRVWFKPACISISNCVAVIP
jgi:hypothetical protein